MTRPFALPSLARPGAPRLTTSGRTAALRATVRRRPSLALVAVLYLGIVIGTARTPATCLLGAVVAGFVAVQFVVSCRVSSGRRVPADAGSSAAIAQPARDGVRS